ncbi:hypothetical protein VF21_10214 [Pseudogymnoascus sp. 05NY08]|nr:hypothetical protein VF21_10214 [Pseudogymnoascus sp. 05NY08]
METIANSLRRLDKSAYDASVGRVKPCQCCVLYPDDWPESNAKVVIRRCMRACPYCGSVFQDPYRLRRHIAEFQAHKARNLTARNERNHDRRRPRMAMAQNEAHEADNPGSPMDEDSSDSENDSGSDGDFPETILESRSAAAAQNDAHDAGNQTHPMGQSPLSSIHSKNGRSNLDGSVRSSFSSAAVQNDAHDAFKQEYSMDHLPPIGHVPPRSDHQGNNRVYPTSHGPFWSNSGFNYHGNTAETAHLGSPWAAAQNNAHDAVNQNSPMHYISPIGRVPPRSDYQSSYPGPPMSQDSPRPSYGTKNQNHLAESLPSGRFSATTQNNVRDCGSQTHAMSQPPQPDQHKGIPAYAAEDLRNTMKISLATLCSDIMATAHSDHPRARRDLDDLKEIANQYFSATESSFDIIRDRADS